MKTKVYMLYALMCVLWGFTWMYLKISLAEMPLYTGLSIRFSIAGIIFWIMYFIKGHKVNLTTDLKNVYLLFTFFNFSLCYYLTYWGAKYVYSNLGAIIWSLLPICVAMMAHFYLPDDRLNKKKAFGMLIGLIGTILLFYERDMLGEGQATFGIIAILLSVVLAAWPNVYLKMQKSLINSYHLNAVGMTLSGILFLICALIFENNAFIPMDNKNLFAIFFLTVPGTVMTWGIYIWLFNHLPVTQISYTAFYPPIIATAVGWFFLGEALPALAIIGSVLIIAGGYLVSSPSKSSG
ncbi:MAG: DMT family transporter [Candidatus Neomarinimicrobiota bacterium]|nr:DMT family transporter [Candidatus Neomarinimicrobiota bacterium]